MASKKRGCRVSEAGQAGAAIIELALLLPLLLVMVAGIIEFGRTLWYYDALSKATRNAARYLSTVDSAHIGTESGSAGSATTLVANGATQASIPWSGNDQVIITCLDPAGIGKTCVNGSNPGQIKHVRVAVSYPLQLGEWIPFVGPLLDWTANPKYTLAPHTTLRYMY